MSSVTQLLNPCVLLVQTDLVFAQKASLDLRAAGYTPVAVTESSQAFSELEAVQPAMVILDSTLAEESGLKFCRQIRDLGYRIPVLILVEKETVNERILCLESGADDYLLKPYHIEKFLHLIRFYLQPTVQPKEQLRFGEVILDLTTRRLFLNGQGIDLTMKEFELLKYLMSHPKEVLTREQILENVWGYNFQGESNVIEVYIRYLRLKMEHDGQKRLIHTVRGVGYVLRET